MNLALLRPAVLLLLVLTLVTGIAYPLAITGVSRLVFPRQSAGSLVTANGIAVGSRLIGQAFGAPDYFWSRPSATSPDPYNAAASSGSNLGPLNPALVEAVKERIAALRAADPANRAPVPVDLVTTSGSGLDPEISLAAAEYQLPRIARARGIPGSSLRTLLREHARDRVLGFFGEPRVNVLELNLALDAAHPRRSPATG